MEPGLIEFTKPKGRKINYFPHLIELLEYLSKTPVRNNQLLSWLNKRSFDQKPKADQRRIFFLETLGLIEEVLEDGAKQWVLTARGKDVLQSSDPKLKFYHLLRNRWDGFQILEQVLSGLGKGEKIFTARKSVEKMQKAQELTSEEALWLRRLRWIESLGFIEEVSFRPKKYRIPKHAYDQLSSAR